MRRREFVQSVTGSVALSGIGLASAQPRPYRPLGRVSVTDATDVVPGSSGEFAYVAATDGFAVIDVSEPSAPEVVAGRRDVLADRELGPLRSIHDLAIEGNRLIVASPAVSPAEATLRGILLYDVSDPANPEQVAFHETDFPIHNCYLSEGVVYLAGNDGEANPLVMVDVSEDELVEVGRWSLFDHDERWEKSMPALRTLHDVWVQDDRAYLSLWDAGTWILDVSDPALPTALGRVGGRSVGELANLGPNDRQGEYFSSPGNAHEAMTNDDGSLLAVGTEAWRTVSRGQPGGVELWDVSDLDAPRLRASIAAPPTPDPTMGGLWTTSHEFDLAGDRLFTSWYQGGVKIHDVSDPSAPEELAWWRDPETASFWTAKLATPEFFVASTGDRRGVGTSGLYTFPNRAGRQQDPPSLTAVEGQTTETTTTENTTTEQAAFGGETTTEADSSSGGVPGFGVPATIAALLGAGAWRKLRD